MFRSFVAMCAVAASIALGGCATVQAITGATVTQSQVDAARNTYDGGYLASLHRYALLPRCAAGQTFLKNQCHDPSTLKKLRAVDKVVAKDFDSVQANLDVGNASALSNSWSVLQNAVSDANSLASSLGL